ncbi:Hypothetical predicted protein [Cloeon dipterum]|uniref:Uncharacterized protein n=1 Tax=Cloeon dipterum TaxID=197152 RepID=A0A8S1DHQ7_9INSE|nr:Hypothetical predicted protein [Cloeon dipterum]
MTAVSFLFADYTLRQTLQNCSQNRPVFLIIGLTTADFVIIRVLRHVPSVGLMSCPLPSQIQRNLIKKKKRTKTS